MESPAETSFPFLCLAGELRNKIYREAFGIMEKRCTFRPRFRISRYDPAPSIPVSLLRACKQIYGEAGSVLYGGSFLLDANVSGYTIPRELPLWVRIVTPRVENLTIFFGGVKPSSGLDPVGTEIWLRKFTSLKSVESLFIDLDKESSKTITAKHFQPDKSFYNFLRRVIGSVSPDASFAFPDLDKHLRKKFQNIEPTALEAIYEEHKAALQRAEAFSRSLEDLTEDFKKLHISFSHSLQEVTEKLKILHISQGFTKISSKQRHNFTEET